MIHDAVGGMRGGKWLVWPVWPVFAAYREDKMHWLRGGGREMRWQVANLDHQSSSIDVLSPAVRYRQAPSLPVQRVEQDSLHGKLQLPGASLCYIVIIVRAAKRFGGLVGEEHRGYFHVSLTATSPPNSFIQPVRSGEYRAFLNNGHDRDDIKLPRQRTGV
jgi:hypothetical protein